MADEQQIITPTPEPESRAQERITQLSEKVRLEAEGRTAAEAKALAAEKKAAFAEGYAEMLSSHPAAKEFKADIQAKVEAGSSVEDATYAVLGKAGKLGAPAPAPTPIQSQQVAGGSAANSIPQGVKSVAEMTQAERRAELEKALIFN